MENDVPHKVGKVWVFNEEDGTLKKKEMRYRFTPGVECWYEDPESCNTVEPFYVDQSRVVLVTRVRKELKRQLETHQAEVKRLKAGLRTIGDG